MDLPQRQRRYWYQTPICHWWTSSTMRCTTYAIERNRLDFGKWFPINVWRTYPSSKSRKLLVQRSTEETSRDTRMVNHHAGTCSTSQRLQPSRRTSWSATSPHPELPNTRLESESDIEIVSSVELGKRLRLMREKAKNKRMKNPLLSAQDSLHDEVACLCTYNGSITKRSSVGDENRPTEKMATETPENFWFSKMRKRSLFGSSDKSHLLASPRSTDHGV